jgi:DNA-binding CsgD family transcriptional regulator
MNTIQERQREMLGIARHMLDVAPQAVLLGDCAGGVLFHNTMAGTILGAGDGLRLAGQRLTARTEQATQRIRAAWSRAIGEPSAHVPRAQLLLVDRVSRQPPYQVSFVGLNTGPSPLGHLADVPVVAVQIFDPVANSRFSKRRLVVLYAMTDAEADVAIAIARGQDPGAYARATNRTVGTVRTLLKRAMNKAGVSRQNALAALLWNGAAGPYARRSG